MQRWLGRMPWALTWLLYLGTAWGAPPSSDQLQCWIRQLDANDFAVRAEADHNLTTAGDAAIDALLSRVCKAGPESAWRASSVLAQIALDGNEQTLRRVTTGLEQLASRGNSGFEGLIRELKTRQARLQQERAVATIRSLRGQFEGDEKAPPPAPASTAVIADAATAIEPPPETSLDQIGSAPEQSKPMGVGFIGDSYVSPEFVNGSENREPEWVLTIDENWRGGDTGLAALLELGNLKTLRLQHAPLTDAALDQIAALTHLDTLDIDDCHFSANALRRFQERQPHTKILVAGK